MRRLTLTKLVVISQSELLSLEVSFSEGLNIILGGNKTGKSSIIKSIFTTFGCECKRVEKSWKDLISEYILFFNYGNAQYCILRSGKAFSIYSVSNEKYHCLIDTDIFQEYSNCLMKLLDVYMPCITNNGSQINITPPLLFRFQYIDQDDGWSKIADSFNNVGYIKQWRAHTNKYVCGYLDDSYYELQAKKGQLSFEKEEKQKELTYNKDFVSHISATLAAMDSSKKIEELQNGIADLFDRLSTLQKSRVSVQANLVESENKAFIEKQRLIAVERNLEETEKDIRFAMDQAKEIVCPTCGAIYSNKLPNQLDISSDYAHCEKLKSELEQRLAALENEIDILKTKDINLVKEIKTAELEISKSQESLSYSLFYKNEGHHEVYTACKKQLTALEHELECLLGQMAVLDDRIKSKKSRKRSSEIKKSIMDKCRSIAAIIDLPTSFIKLNDFVQVIEHTGSETPRLVYMYQTALYLYNLERSESPFNFYVIDTPNQQGQDEDNLIGIFESLNLLLEANGQVLVGTERKTGLENIASNVIQLTEKRHCLNALHYQEHIKLLGQLRASLKANQ